VKHAHDEWVDAIPVHGRLIIINVRVFLQVISPSVFRQC